MVFRDKLSENTAVDIHFSDGPDLYSGDQIIHPPGGPKPSSHAGYFINLRSHVLCSITAALSEAVASPCPPSPLCADGTGVYLYLEGLFSSVALVNGILTGQVRMPLCQTGSSSFNSWIFAGVGVHVLQPEPQRCFTSCHFFIVRSDQWTTIMYKLFIINCGFFLYKSLIGFCFFLFSFSWILQDK